MKLVIQHSKTKREINGSFSICGTREDLESIAGQIRRHLEGDEPPFVYGWLTIYADVPDGGVGVSPVHWDS